MEAYPDHDFPFTLFFQGTPMPRWSNCWHFQPVPDGDYDWYVERVHTRLHHVGKLESEEAGIFLVAAQEVLLRLIDGKFTFLKGVMDLPDPPETVYGNFVSGLCAMIRLAESESVVFWTSGYESDRQMIEDSVRRFRLGETHPDYLLPPHRIDERVRIESGIEQQRRKLRSRSRQSGLGKELRGILHRLPKRTG